MLTKTKKKRKYTLGRRAESQADTRQRIVEAAIELHRTFGPAQTTISMLAERAGVQRHTVYAHFPDELSLQVACSGLFYERDPFPDHEPWRAIADMQERLRTGLGELYQWYARNADMVAAVQRDVQHHKPTQEITKLRVAPHMRAYREVLGEKLNDRQRAMLGLALNFPSWRALVRDGGLSQETAADLMADAIVGLK
jgi:AcrR family transcriptional regulator